MRTCYGWQEVILLNGALVSPEDLPKVLRPVILYGITYYQANPGEKWLGLARTDNPKAIVARSAEE